MGVADVYSRIAPFRSTECPHDLLSSGERIQMELDLKEWLKGSSLFRRLCLMCNQPMIGPRDVCRSRPKCTSNV